MKNILINGWTLWLLATFCLALALGFNVGIGDGFAGAALGLGIASVTCMIRDAA